MEVEICETFRKSLFVLLPNEVLIKILSNVDTLTVFNFCAVYNCDYFLNDKAVIQTVCFYKNYKLLPNVANKIACEHVTTLNVNCVYWISGEMLRNWIRKLENLEDLYAIHTNLNLGQKDLETFSRMSRLRKLGVSLAKGDQIGNCNVPNIHILYIHACDVKSIALAQRSLSSIFSAMNKIWIEVDQACGNEILIQNLANDNTIKIFCVVDPPIPYLDFKHCSLTAYYSNRRYLQRYVTCCEKFSPEPTPTPTLQTQPILQSWKALQDLHYCAPYGPKDARRLLLQEATFDNIFFEELNFSHNCMTCHSKLRTAIMDILKSVNAQRLKRLSVMMCLFQVKNLQDFVPLENPNNFTRKRIGVETSIESHPVDEVFRNFLGLTHLQIFVCNNISHYDSIQGYGLISILENLQSLIVEVPISVDGKFLIEVLNKCKDLQVLHITSTGQNENLNNHLFIAIPSAAALKDFRYENFRIPVDKLLQQLCLMKSQTLERILIECKETDKFSEKPLIGFIEGNPQLVFLYFLLCGCTEVAVRTAQQTLNTYKKKHPSKAFFVKKRKDFHRAGYPIPDVHYYEMVRPKHDVATLRPLEHFRSF